MKKKVLKFTAATVVAALVVGCETPPKSVVDTEENGEVQDVVLVLERESIQDDNFILYFDENPDKCTFHTKCPGATIADLANFAMQTCWAKRLSHKFTVRNSEPLTDNDIKLAEFCLDTHFMFLDTLSVAMLNDLTQNDKIVQDYFMNKSSYRVPNPNPDISLIVSTPNKLDGEIDSIYNDLKVNFLLSTDSPIRNSIREWGKRFESENTQESNWLSVYSGIYNQMPSVDIEKVEDNPKSWLWMPKIVCDNEGREIAVTQQPDNGVATVETAEAWAVMESMTRRYLNSLNSIYGTIRKYHSNLSLVDRGALEKSQSVMQKKGANVNAYNRFFRGALYDMPLSFYALRGYAGCYSNWHWYGDDEAAMFDAAKYMVMGIRGIEMISNARSLYSIHAYNSTVSFLKNKLSEAEFQTLLTDTKMYHVDINNDTDGENKLTPYGENIKGDDGR